MRCSPSWLPRLAKSPLLVLNTFEESHHAKSGVLRCFMLGRDGSPRPCRNPAARPRLVMVRPWLSCPLASPPALSSAIPAIFYISQPILLRSLLLNKPSGDYRRRSLLPCGVHEVSTRSQRPSQGLYCKVRIVTLIKQVTVSD